jgi:hypothetical protein
VPRERPPPPPPPLLQAVLPSAPADSKGRGQRLKRQPWTSEGVKEKELKKLQQENRKLGIEF